MRSVLRDKPRTSTRRNRVLTSEQLERRETFAVDISYDAVTDALKLVSNSASDQVQIENSASLVLVKVNGTMQRILGGSFAPVSSVSFYGNGGDDKFTNKTSIPSTAYGGSGNDYLTGGPAKDNFFGEAGNDLLMGNGGDDILNGDSGDDILSGDAGNDSLSGGSENDMLFGGPDNDQLFGDNGADQLVGGIGNDRMDGGFGDDIYRFASEFSSSGVQLDLGADSIVDLAGIDELDFSRNQTGVKVNLSQGTKQEVNPRLRLTLNSSVIEIIQGSNQDDFLIGNQADNKLNGNGGNDTLYGRAGRDTLNGGEGDDGLFGGEGSDTMVGGNGDDRFLTHRATSTSTLYDYPSDLKPSEDALIYFVNGAAESFLGYVATAGAWTDLQIEQADVALDKLHKATGNTKLLKWPDDRGNPKGMEFFMHGSFTSPIGSSSLDIVYFGNRFAQNVDARKIYYWAGQNLAQGTALGTARKNEWDAISGWTVASVQPSANHTRAIANTDLWVLKDAVFARSVGRHSAASDMGTAFEAYFSKHNNEAVNGSGLPANRLVATSIDAIPLKKAFLDRLFASLI